MSDSAMKDVGVAVVATILLGAGGIWYGSTATNARGYFNPTCDDPKGLRPVGLQSLTANGTGQPDYGPSKAVDGYVGTEWAPPTVSKDAPEHKGISKFDPVFPDGPSSVLTLRFAEDMSSQPRIALVCANNALGAGDERYANWGKARSIRVWTDGNTGDSTTAVLQVEPQDRASSSQKLADHLGNFEELHLQLVDAYAGNDIVSHDPDRCADVIGTNPDYEKRDLRSIKNQQPTYAPGCIVAATANAGISEVALYEKDPNDTPPLPWNLLYAIS